MCPRFVVSLFEPQHDRTNKMTHTPSEDSGPASLIIVFAVCMKKSLALNYPESAQRRLIRMGGCPGWSESSLGAVVTLLAWSCCGSFTSFCLGSVGGLWSSIVALHWELFIVFFHTWFLNAVLVISRAFSAYFLRRKRPWLLRLPIPSDQINSFRRRWKDNDQEPLQLDSPPTHKMSAFENS